MSRNYEEEYLAGYQAAKGSLGKIEKLRPEAYESEWQATLDNLLDQIVNRKEFSYDYNQDPLYQNYVDSYTAKGQRAMQDVSAQASALTGGYGSSAATTAASNVYQDYMKELAGKIPELYNLAMDKYKLDSNELQAKYSTVGNQEDREYGKYRDVVGDWQTDRGYALDKYAVELQAQQFAASYNQAERHFNAQMAYNYSKLV
jgi:hypothetical protein